MGVIYLIPTTHRPKAVPKLICALLTMSEQREEVIDILVGLSEEDWQWVVDRYSFWNGMTDIIADIQVLRDFRA